MDRKLLKTNAKRQLGGGIFQSNWLNALLVCLLEVVIISAVTGIISGFGGIFSGINIARNMLSDPDVLLENGVLSFSATLPFAGVGSILGVLISGPLAFGSAKIFLKLVRGSDRVEVSELFDGFKTDLGGNLLLPLMIYLFTALWSLLFVIPGIVKSYAYSFAYYVKADHPDYDWRQCLDASKELTKGYKWDLFVLDLSFIGWLIVGAMVLGIGELWVYPYVACTKANAYEYICAQKSAGFAA